MRSEPVERVDEVTTKAGRGIWEKGLGRVFACHVVTEDGGLASSLLRIRQAMNTDDLNLLNGYDRMSTPKSLTQSHYSHALP